MLDNTNGMYMPVAPMGGYYGNNNDFFGGNGLWFLLIWMAMFGWGGNGFGGFNGNGAYSEVQRGFDQNAVMSGNSYAGNSYMGNSYADGNSYARDSMGRYPSRDMVPMSGHFPMTPGEPRW